MQEIKNSNIIDSNLPTWDLSDLYSGINDDKIVVDINNLTKKVEDFNKEYINKVKYLYPIDFLKALIEYEGINESIAKIESFAYLKYSEDVTLEDNVIFYQKITETTTNLYSKLIFFDL